VVRSVVASALLIVVCDVWLTNAMIRAARGLVGGALRFVLNVAGRAYVPGYRLDDAMAVARSLSEQRIACTLGYFHDWSETSGELTDLSCRIIDSVAELEPCGYVSIKVPPFGYSPDVVTVIVRHAMERGVLAHFDSHEIGTADRTLASVKLAATLGGRVGLTIPGRWPRSRDDAIWARDLGLRVRVVKGEWADPAAPDIDLRQGFLDVIDRLSGCSAEVAVATHDPWLAREALRRLQSTRTPCEIELLNGLPRRRLLAVAREFSVPVRVYLPFGISWRPYAMSKVADNPRMLWWVIRDSIVGLGLPRRH
jgi:proline dehydrogenase